VMNRSSKQIMNQKLLDSGYVFSYPSYVEGYQAIID
jgi:hypothetical protein